MFDEIQRSTSVSSKPSETPYILSGVEELGQVRIIISGLTAICL